MNTTTTTTTITSLEMSTAKQFIQKLGLKYPLIQAPMAGSAPPALAAAVTSAGGLGSIPLGTVRFSDPSALRTLLTNFQRLVPITKAHTVNLNLFAHAIPNSDPEGLAIWTRYVAQWLGQEQDIQQQQQQTKKEPTPLAYETVHTLDQGSEFWQTLLEFEPAMVSFHFGLPPAWVLSDLQERSVLCTVSVTNEAEYAQAVEAGIDVIILQGWDAGGHRGSFVANDPNDEKLSTADLLAAVTRNNDNASAKPWLIPAGGISTPAQASKYLVNPQVAAVQLGTYFLLATESSAPDRHRKLLLSGITDENSEELLTVPMPFVTGRVARSIATDAMKRFLKDTEDQIEKGSVRLPEYPYPAPVYRPLSVARDKKGMEGDGYGMYLAGAGHKELKSGSAKELVERMGSELKY